VGVRRVVRRKDDKMPTDSSAFEDLAALVPELVVSDFVRSLAFYTEVLGFRVLYGRPEQRFAYLAREGAQLMIEQPTDRAWLTGPLEAPYGRGINLQIACSDAAALRGRCLARGLALYMDLEDAWYRRDAILLGSRQFLVQDPDGYLLRFSEAIGTRPA
jgi:catechol 2,3-dioxygenase-like lactoylglutathione lyase family enzyme